MARPGLDAVSRPDTFPSVSLLAAVLDGALSSTGDLLPGSEVNAGTTILVVEDEHALRAAIRRLLQSAGYRVLEAEHGAAALEVLNAPGSAGVALVLTDLRMPVMDGRQFAAALARLRPDLPIVFMSGFTAQLMDMRLVSPHLAFLAKPFNNETLLAAVRAQLAPPD